MDKTTNKILSYEEYIHDTILRKAIEYNENEKPSEIYQYSNGKLEGWQLRFFTNGDTLEKYFLLHGKIFGNHMIYRNGNVIDKYLFEGLDHTEFMVQFNDSTEENFKVKGELLYEVRSKKSISVGDTIHINVYFPDVSLFGGSISTNKVSGPIQIKQEDIRRSNKLFANWLFLECVLVKDGFCEIEIIYNSKLGTFRKVLQFSSSKYSSLNQI